MNEEERIAALFAAKPDPEYYKRHGTFSSHAGMRPKVKTLEVYVRGDEPYTEEGTYIRIAVDDGYVYISRDMIERLAEKLQEVTFY